MMIRTTALIATLFLSVQTINNTSKETHEKPNVEERDSMDSYFEEYAREAELYINRFPGSPLNGEILSECARNAYDSTGIIVPVELALSQAQWESGMGRSGRNPVTNPFNIGEHDSGTVLRFQSTEEGTQAYFYRMCNDYLSCQSLNALLHNFVSCDGYRYASKPTYEETISDQYHYIQRWIEKNDTFEIEIDSIE